MTSEAPQRLRRELGLGGATMMGLGAMVGTGVFVSIGIAAGLVWHRLVTRLWRTPTRAKEI